MARWRDGEMARGSNFPEKWFPPSTSSLSEARDYYGRICNNGERIVFSFSLSGFEAWAVWALIRFRFAYKLMVVVVVVMVVMGVRTLCQW